MKRKLLFLACLAVSYAANSQSYYPSGNTVAPTWSYDDVINDNGGNTINDATVYYGSGSMVDAYDGAFKIFVGAVDSVYTESGATTNGVDTTGTLITTAEQLINGFYVSKSYFFSPNDPVVRAVFKVRNPSDSMRTTLFGVETNFGSDGDTQIDSAYVSQDTLVDADRWMITSDGIAFGNDGDPINTMVRFGEGNIAVHPHFHTQPAIDGSDNFIDTFNLVIPANSYRLVMQFNRIDSTVATAKNNVGVFNSVFNLDTAGYLQGMTNSDLLKVVNWRFAPLACEPINTTLTASVCHGSTYEFAGIEYSESGSYSDTLMTTEGCDSVVTLVLTVNDQITSTVSATVCNGSSYVFNGVEYTQAGSYTDTLIAANGCDSLVTLELTVTTVEATATFENGVLHATPGDATYQWINCANNTAIEGATSQNFEPTANGSYAVVVTSQNECSDTSACVVVNDLGLNDLSAKVAVSVSPNPGNGQFDVVSSEQITKVVVKNVSGQVVTEMTPANETCVIDIRTQANGVYFVNVITANTQKVVKVIKK